MKAAAWWEYMALVVGDDRGHMPKSITQQVDVCRMCLDDAGV